MKDRHSNIGMVNALLGVVEEEEEDINESDGDYKFHRLTV